jgi:ABC-2 type transport system permease protein
MAVHDLGYRGWTGVMSGASSRWLVIAATGIRRAWQSNWLRRIILFAWLPAFIFAFGFFFWEKSLLTPGFSEPIRGFVENAPPDFQRAVLKGMDDQNPASARHGMWAWLLYSFFRKPQGFVMVVVIGLIAPPLISQDIRSRAFLLYFSRPITRRDYVVGKYVTVFFYLALISTLPALALYALGVLLSPSLSVVSATWDLPLRILAASAVLAIPTASLALFLSSMTQESRIAGFAWFAIWILGSVTYWIMTGVDAANSQQPPDFDRWANASLYHTLGRVESWVFGFADFSEVRSSALILLVITVVTVVFLFRRVAAPMRV